MVAKGQSQEENQVSRTSGSWVQFSSSAGGSMPTWMSPEAAWVWSSEVSWSSEALSLRYQTGTWWPHQSWREMHQSWMFSIQWM